MVQACEGSGQRRALAEVSEAPAAQEGGEEMLRRKVNRLRASALNPTFDDIKITFENWRLGGQHVGSEDLMDEFDKVCELTVSELQRSSFSLMRNLSLPLRNAWKPIGDVQRTVSTH